MSHEASLYVTELVECPDGAELTAIHKAVLWYLADAHNTSTRLCCPGLSLISHKSRVKKDTLKRVLHYLEDHCVIKRVHPKNQGRGQMVRFVFLALDTPAELAQMVRKRGKGMYGAPLFSSPERGDEGVQTPPERGAEGVQIGIHNKEEPITKSNQEPSPRARAQAGPSLSQAERDTLDMKRFQAVMKKLKPEDCVWIRDPDARWIQDTRQAAYDAGIAPARIVELLKQHFPDDPNIDRLYPKGNTL